MDGKSEKRIDLGTEARLLFSGKAALQRAAEGRTSLSQKKANWLQSREQIYSSWLPRTVLRAAMGKNLTSIPGTSGPSHPLQSTIQPILGVLEQFWPKHLAEQANPTASQGLPLAPSRSSRRCVCHRASGRNVFGRNPPMQQKVQLGELRRVPGRAGVPGEGPGEAPAPVQHLSLIHI